jgi:hypothetical protein
LGISWPVQVIDERIVLNSFWRNSTKESWIQLTEDGFERWARVKVVMDLWASQKVWSFLTSWRLGVVNNKVGRICVSWDWIRQALEGTRSELLFRVPWNVANYPCVTNLRSVLWSALKNCCVTICTGFNWHIIDMFDRL